MLGIWVRPPLADLARLGPWVGPGWRGGQVYFTGCSWQLAYHVGVVHGLRESGVSLKQYSGASSGSLVALCLASGLKPSAVMQVMTTLGRRRRGAPPRSLNNPWSNTPPPCLRSVLSCYIA